MKMDPSSRKMSDYQWEQAYAAYKRVRGHSSGESKDGGQTEESDPRPVGNNRLRKFRQNTAYAKERKYVDRFFYVSLALILIRLFLTIAGSYLGIYMGEVVFVFLQSVFFAGVAVLIRYLAHVFLDIPDIALQQVPERDPDAPLED